MKMKVYRRSPARPLSRQREKKYLQLNLPAQTGLVRGNLAGKKRSNNPIDLSFLRDRRDVKG